MKQKRQAPIAQTSAAKGWSPARADISSGAAKAGVPVIRCGAALPSVMRLHPKSEIATRPSAESSRFSGGWECEQTRLHFAAVGWTS
jgi:hypothetical protein